MERQSFRVAAGGPFQHRRRSDGWLKCRRLAGVGFDGFGDRLIQFTFEPSPSAGREAFDATLEATPRTDQLVRHLQRRCDCRIREQWWL